jgi:hypothetical protein
MSAQADNWPQGQPAVVSTTTALRKTNPFPAMYLKRQNEAISLFAPLRPIRIFSKRTHFSFPWERRRPAGSEQSALGIARSRVE